MAGEKLEMKRDIYNRLTANVEVASLEESNEILDVIESMSKEDLKIVSIKKDQIVI